MDIEARRRELRQQVGIFGRITSAADIPDRWHRRLASWLKPRHLVAVSSGSAFVVLLLLLFLWTAGFSIVPRERFALLAVVESAVPNLSELSAADLRVRSSAAARAIMLIDNAITSRPADPKAFGWYARIFGKTAPQLDPGREAAFLNLIDNIVAHPVESRTDIVDRMVMWAAASLDGDVWALLKKIGDSPPKIRAAFIQAGGGDLLEVLVWMRERQEKTSEVRSLEAAVVGHRLELDDQTKALQEQLRKMTAQLEASRDLRQTCTRHVRAFESCMTVRNR